MQTNNVFSIQRMQFYLYKHFTDHYRFYGMGILTIFGICTIIGVLMIVGHNPIDRTKEIAPIYYTGLFLGGLLFTSRSFGELGSKEKGVDFLMLPASQFEKFITIFLVSSIGYLLFYHISCYLSFKIVESMQLAVLGLPIKRDYQFFTDPEEKKYIFYAYVILQSAILLGATYFHKYSFIKTTLCIFLLLFGLYIINSIFVTLLFGIKGEFWKRSVPFLMVNELLGGPVAWHTKTYVVPQWLIDTYLFCVRWVIAPVLWTMAYFRLKDQEI